MVIALLIAMGVVTVAGAGLVTMLLMSDQGNAETKAGILVVFLMQVIKLLYDQVVTNQADAQRLLMQRSLEEVKASSNEAVGSARADMASYIKSDDLHELDELADGFVKKTLNLPQSERFLALLNERLDDNLTRVQKAKVLRAIEIMKQEIVDPKTEARDPATQTVEEAAHSKEKQAGHEKQQREDGTRKEKSEMDDDAERVTPEKEISPATQKALASPRAIEAAKAAAVSAKETERLTEKTRTIVGQETRKAERKEQKDDPA